MCNLQVHPLRSLLLCIVPEKATRSNGRVNDRRPAPILNPTSTKPTTPATAARESLCIFFLRHLPPPVNNAPFEFVALEWCVHHLGGRQRACSGRRRPLPPAVAIFWRSGCARHNAFLWYREVQAGRHQSGSYSYFTYFTSTSWLVRKRPCSHLCLAVNKNLQVINLNKFGGVRASSSRRDPGSEPGVDPRRATVNALYSHVHEECEIEVVDYSASKVEFNQYDNQGFLQFIAQNHKPTWAKVRWINIAGISWDILASLALAYGMFSAFGSPYN